MLATEENPRAAHDSDKTRGAAKVTRSDRGMIPGAESRLAMVNSRIDPDGEGRPLLSDLYEFIMKGHENDADRIKSSVDLMEDFCASNEPISALTRELRKLADDDQYVPRSFLKETFVFFQNDMYSLYLEVLRPRRDRRVVTSAPSSAAVRVMSPEGRLRFRRFRLPVDTDISIFNPDLTPEPIEDVILTRANRPHSYAGGELTIIDVEHPVVVMKLVENSAIPFSWSFDPKTLKPLFIAASLPSISRLETLIDVVDEFNDKGRTIPRSVELLNDMLDNPLHFVRWRAVQSLAKIDPEAAGSVLIKLQKDPHPHVAAAAAKAVLQHNLVGAS